MKFICDRNILLKEISIAQEIIASKNAISILSNVYLETSKDSLIIKATDNKVNFESVIPVNVIESGATTVFGDKFFGILSGFPYDEIEFSQKDTNNLIKPVDHKKPEYKLRNIAADKFSEFPVSGSQFFNIPIKEFKEMVQQTIFSVSDDETRYNMNGVNLEKEKGKIIMVSTDGRRLAYISKDIGDDIDDFSGIIIPPKILNIIIKRAGDEGFISMSVSNKIVFVKFGQYKFSSVLLEGQFPNYRKVIPEKQDNSLTVKRLEMLDALHRVGIMLDKKGNRIYLGIEPGKLALYSEENEIGNVDDEIPCKYDGEELTVALNYRYIEEPFKAINTDDICISFTKSDKAITIFPVPEKDFFHIVMPMQA
ncbi:MAG: DNA polymerase III subunit beta [Treponema sp.]|jgi:DNA polymerase-3 subunit beta|nr:DNA polymerase III subunit beta [Treponema sp.]